MAQLRNMTSTIDRKNEIKELPKRISDILLKYQTPHVITGANILRIRNRLLDCSDAGTGKTFTTIAICAALGLLPFIISPLSVCSAWTKVLDIFGIKYIGITNYESFQYRKYYKYGSSHKSTFPYMTINEKSTTEIDFSDLDELKVNNDSDEELCFTVKPGKHIEDDEYSLYTPSKRKSNPLKSKDVKITWKLPKNAVVIFDEAHRCKNVKTINSKILASLAGTDTKIILLSATICDKLENFAMCGYVLKLYDNISNARHWIRMNTMDEKDPVIKLHKILYPTYACRMKIKELGTAFPSNQILCECFDMDAHKEIDKLYEIIDENNTFANDQMMHARMKIEKLKIPTFIEQTNKYIAEGNSVVIFVNFTETLNILSSELKTSCVVYGEQKKEVREKNVNDFQEDKERIIICNIKSGGVAISLHDIKGNFPRVTLISPDWSAQNIIQCIGRCHRANGKTPVRQRIIFCAKSVEETMCESLKHKISTIATFNDGKIDAYHIKGLIGDETKIMMNNEKPDISYLIGRIEAYNTNKIQLQQQIEKLMKELTETEKRIQICTLELQKVTSDLHIHSRQSSDVRTAHIETYEKHLFYE